MRRPTEAERCVDRRRRSDASTDGGGAMRRPTEAERCVDRRRAVEYGRY
ncbi:MULTISPECIES: hypothetical protein [Halorubrum]|nr:MULTISPECIES: hypothetical protein [Halorubrum]